jgi:hypothetical protein
MFRKDMTSNAKRGRTEAVHVSLGCVRDGEF